MSNLHNLTCIGKLLIDLNTIRTAYIDDLTGESVIDTDRKTHRFKGYDTYLNLIYRLSLHTSPDTQQRLSEVSWKH